ncbi:pyridoxamine 5'-phosphate oxidase family protein [Nocardia yunnanensis]|uniref:Pyridoxamine 5'-phosphate oxidase family protein n=1 Tax=Nocardia yunnanensis TaxID=2382165 RepID=A0A386Z927_9NOCA|nr:pyridoxamine 5'-phosphate oxidase family protein [Nocardia yunnanensis]AYF73717.1 pyridoxamine 5'-phosphate oxidase family protein [Nocardia yunnanensis]
MTLEQNWDRIREVVARAGHCALASVDADGGPHVTPIGTVFLRDDATGFYFDEYTEALARNLDADPRVCLMAVDTRPTLWGRMLLTGRFPTAPGVRLYGTVGATRPATAEELRRVRERVRIPVRLKGGRMLWSNFGHVRDISFTDYRPVGYPHMPSPLQR